MAFQKAIAEGQLQKAIAQGYHERLPENATATQKAIV